MAAPTIHIPAIRLRRIAGGTTGAGVLAFVAVSHGRVFADALARVLAANPCLAAAGAVLEALSVLGYVVLFHHVVSRSELSRRESYDVTLASTSATRLLPTAGAGGIAVTVWALRRRGVGAREVGERMGAFLLLLYGVYTLALATGGLLVAAGVGATERGHQLALAGVLIGSGVALAALTLPARAQGIARRARALGRLGSVLSLLHSARARAADQIRRPHPALAGGLAWWGFDIAVLGVMLHAFGASPAIPALVLAYFLGTLCNVLPLPGSLSGGLIATLGALGTPAGAAIAAVLAYRTVAVWLPAAWGLPSLARLRAFAQGECALR